MIRISDEEIINQHGLLIASYKGGSNVPFLEDKYLKKILTQLHKKAAKNYPYEVKIPKSLEEMIQGDFSPARVIKIEEPLQGPYGPIWFGDSASGILIRLGYKNGDSRFISDVTFDDSTIHGIMAGATGQGKSVTLNAMIYGICMEYAPWEVKLTLSDAKIVEFKSIALNNPMPDIDIIAATGDTDYLVSVLESKVADMVKTNNVFTSAGQVFGQDIKSIEQFRKITGLALPRNLMVFDEFQTMLKGANKTANHVVGLIDSFVRLGRNSGFHCLLASQELGSDLPKTMLGNVAIRMALGCTTGVSESILGNTEAKNFYGKKGFLLVNTNSEGKNSKDNVMIRVPFMPGDQARIISSSVIDMGVNLNTTPVLKFYDEQKVRHEGDYCAWLDTLELDKSKIYLGEPSYITEDKDQCLKMEMRGDSIENICVISITDKNLLRYFKMLKMNIMKHADIINVVMSAKNIYTNDGKANELAQTRFYEEKDLSTSTMIAIATDVVYRRGLCMEVDKRVFENASYNEVSDGVFYKLFEHGSKEDTITNRARCYNIMGLLETDNSYINGLGLQRITDLEKLYNKKLTITKSCINMWLQYNSAEVKLTTDKMPMIYNWILGADSILGLVQDSNSQRIASLKKVLQRSSEVNCRFIMFTTTFEDISDLRSGFKWFILDDILNNECNRIKCEDYPADKAPVLGVLFDAINKSIGCKKFKKMIFDGEII